MWFFRRGLKSAREKGRVDSETKKQLVTHWEEEEEKRKRKKDEWPGFDLYADAAQDWEENWKDYHNEYYDVETKSRAVLPPNDNVDKVAPLQDKEGGSPMATGGSGSAHDGAGEAGAAEQGAKAAAPAGEEDGEEHEEASDVHSEWGPEEPEGVSPGTEDVPPGEAPADVSPGTEDVLPPADPPATEAVPETNEAKNADPPAAEGEGVDPAPALGYGELLSSCGGSSSRFSRFDEWDLSDSMFFRPAGDRPRNLQDILDSSLQSKRRSKVSLENLSPAEASWWKLAEAKTTNITKLGKVTPFGVFVESITTAANDLRRGEGATSVEEQTELSFAFSQELSADSDFLPRAELDKIEGQYRRVFPDDEYTLDVGWYRGSVHAVVTVGLKATRRRRGVLVHTSTDTTGATSVVLAPTVLHHSGTPITPEGGEQATSEVEKISDVGVLRSESGPSGMESEPEKTEWADADDRNPETAAEVPALEEGLHTQPAPVFGQSARTEMICPSSTLDEAGQRLRAGHLPFLFAPEAGKLRSGVPMSDVPLIVPNHDGGASSPPPRGTAEMIQSSESVGDNDSLRSLSDVADETVAFAVAGGESGAAPDAESGPPAAAAAASASESLSRRIAPSDAAEEAPGGTAADGSPPQSPEAAEDDPSRRGGLGVRIGARYRRSPGGTHREVEEKSPPISDVWAADAADPSAAETPGAEGTAIVVAPTDSPASPIDGRATTAQPQDATQPAPGVGRLRSGAPMSDVPLIVPNHDGFSSSPPRRGTIDAEMIQSFDARESVGGKDHSRPLSEGEGVAFAAETQEVAAAIVGAPTDKDVVGASPIDGRATTQPQDATQPATDDEDDWGDNDFHHDDSDSEFDMFDFAANTGGAEDTTWATVEDPSLARQDVDESLMVKEEDIHIQEEKEEGGLDDFLGQGGGGEEGAPFFGAPPTTPAVGGGAPGAKDGGGGDFGKKGKGKKKGDLKGKPGKGSGPPGSPPEVVGAETSGHEDVAGGATGGEEAAPCFGLCPCFFSGAAAAGAEPVGQPVRKGKGTGRLVPVEP